MQIFFRNFFSEFKEYVVLILLLIISLSLLSINEKPQIKKVRTLALGGFAFFQDISSTIIGGFTESSDIKELKKINARLMLENNRLREYGLENHELKSMLAIKDTSKFRLVPAKIISKLVSKVQGNFIINVGNNDSVKVGMPVINYQGLVGIITEAGSNFAVARTLHNSELKLAVTNQRSGVNGILSWNGENTIIKNISTNYDNEIGDRIITSEFSTILPPSIPVGIIAKKETNISGLLSNLIIKPFIDLTQVKNIFVLRVLESKQVDNLELNLLKK